eukprot:11320758-Alexandrium_andersonii.AAC.1
MPFLVNPSKNARPPPPTAPTRARNESARRAHGRDVLKTWRGLRKGRWFRRPRQCLGSAAGK